MNLLDMFLGLFTFFITRTHSFAIARKSRDTVMPSVHKMVKHTLKILKHFYCKIFNVGLIIFRTLGIVGLNQ